MTRAHVLTWRKDLEVRALLDAPGSETLKGKRDRAILSVLIYHGVWRALIARYGGH